VWRCCCLCLLLLGCGGAAAPGVLTADPGSPLLAEVGVELDFDSSDSEGAVSYHWVFGDGDSFGPSSEQSTTHTYEAPGHYTAVLTVADEAGRSATAARQVSVHHPLLEPSPSFAARLAGSQSGETLFVVLPDFDRVAVVDVGQGELVAHVETCAGPMAVAHATGAAVLAVACPDSAQVDVLDTSGLPASNASLLHRLDLPRGSQPVAAVLSAAGDELYVVLQGTGELHRFDGVDVPSDGLTASWVREGFVDPRGLAVVGQDLLLSRHRSASDAATWFRVSRDGGTHSQHVLAFDPGPDSDTTSRGVPSYLQQVAVSPDGRVALFPSLQANTERGQFLDGLAMTHETTARAVLSRASLLDEDFGVELPPRKLFDNRDLAVAAAFAPRGEWLFVATLGSEAVEILDPWTLQTAGSFQDIGRGVDGLWVDPEGEGLWVSAGFSRELFRYPLDDFLTAGKLRERIDLRGGVPEVLDEQVLLGKQIFHRAVDVRMSGDSYLSCASCHLDGDHDGRTWDFSDRGEGLRNTSSLLGRSGLGHGPLHWSANFDELQDFEIDIRGPMAGQGFMSDEDWDVAGAPLGPAKTGRSAELDALAAYVTSLTAVPPSPFRDALGDLTVEAEAGEELFLSAETGCADCHPPPEYTDSSWLEPGLPLVHDVGTLVEGSGLRLGETLDGMDTPTLRGVWSSAPYLHDGSAATLREVLVDRNLLDLHGSTSGLSGDQVDSLVAFLQQIE